MRVRHAATIALLLPLAACTSVKVKPIDLDDHKILHVCIQRNSAVIVTDMLEVLQGGLQRHAISSEIIHSHARPTHCEYVMRYRALQSWDFTLYLSDADIWLDRSGAQIAHAKYHLTGTAFSMSLLKWKGTASKLDPVIDELLGK